MPSPRFTPESARAAGERGNLAQANARRQRAERLASLANDDDFRQDSLARARDLLTATFQRAAKASDPKDLELLARALSSLAETERKLAGRPLPGSRRPAAQEPPAPRSPLPVPR